ncbi:hypothetical protein PHYBLDRAFT_147287 [Phycomyces blakesleeanus NRRL 1555(-)]|uniref:Uncharacterized protein n=1 Tax=Phycomyces blakesleeanus (strain ATCC 8743b / DSM 1359 / FGSC 10004 / NBRC 33097 / NRRL 1555) TaxID=763407 RepID=A0A163A782_PHYB8|nr:hypothetical protein PHYBLDRAFT_147287 [Phycomyces blakesleeanus NRRL 1555(-)]OAD71541.1 hypothetical protein PHYBLDRAFT_147287 [Phycomyces blakesleeanus NRRL 1555(-)]|eukprot:XP_018289581.1 hypothetical protein PHYBLDRAFT_147287 [Phycomyces blakesleeanus NRRL 1555(-)]
MHQRKKNETSRGNHYVIFTCPYRKNRNTIVHFWLVGKVQSFYQCKDSRYSLHFLAFVEIMKEHDAAGHDSSVPTVR